MEEAGAILCLAPYLAPTHLAPFTKHIRCLITPSIILYRLLLQEVGIDIDRLVNRLTFPFPFSLCCSGQGLAGSHCGRRSGAGTCVPAAARKPPLE